MSKRSLHVRICVDGGARGNPGPAAAGVVIHDAKDGAVLHQAGVFLGGATNNVAEYRALLYGLEVAAKLGAVGADVLSDSQLMVRQMTGHYRVRNDGLRPRLCPGLAAWCLQRARSPLGRPCLGPHDTHSQLQ